MNAEQILAMLHIESPDGSVQIVPIGASPVSLGRTADNQVPLSSQLVSRRHARLSFEGDAMLLTDLGSSNGTRVGEERLAPETPYTLSYGERFHIDPYSLHLEPAAAQPAAEPIEPVAEAKPKSAAEPKPARVRIGVEAAPPPPPPSTPGPPPDEDEPYTIPPWLPAEGSRYVQYLPPIYREHPFVGQFLLAFEAIMTSVEQSVDHFDLLLDPRTAPAGFLDELAGWLGMTLDENWPAGKRRAILREAVELYRRRGTRRGLSRHLGIYAGAPLDEPIDEWVQISEPADRPHHFDVRLRLPRGENADRATLERIIEANKPAHTTYRLEITEE